MADCFICGEETHLYLGTRPICRRCDIETADADAEWDKVQAEHARFDRLRAELRALNAALEAGTADGDSTTMAAAIEAQIRVAASRYRSALEKYRLTAYGRARPRKH